METGHNNYLLSDVVDQFYAVTFNDKKAYFSNYLLIAKIAWNELFKKTFYSSKNVALPLEHDSTGYFIRKPSDCTRVLGVSVDDDCGRHPLLINSKVPLETSTIPKGSCRECDSDLCAIIDSSIILRSEVFNGRTYQLKTYIDRYSSGELVEVKEVMEHDAESNKDVKVQQRKSLCTLKVYPCGCPEPIAENLSKIKTCGCNCLGYAVCCRSCEKEQPSSKYGYFNYEIDSNKIRLKSAACSSLPSMLILAFQSNGEANMGELQVPWYALTVMFEGLKFYGGYREHPNLREAYKRNWERAKTELMMYLTPFDPVAFRSVQGILPKWG